MHAKKLLSVLIAGLLFGCSSPIVQIKSAEDKFMDIIRDNIKDKAKKNTADCKIYSLNILKIDTITGHALDSQLLIKALDRLEICNVMADLYTSMSKTDSRINALNKKKKQGYLPDIASEDMENDTYKAQLYRDSAGYYSHLLDSLNKVRIYDNRFSDTVYQIRSFLKATERKNNDSTHYFGIKYYYISKNNKVLELSDTEAGNIQSSLQ